MKKLFMIGIIVIVLVLLTGCSRDSKESETVAINCGGDRIYVAEKQEFTLGEEYFDVVSKGNCTADGGNIIISYFPKGKWFYEPIVFKEGERIIIPTEWERFIIFRRE